MRFKKTKNFLLALLFVAPPYVLPYPGPMPGNKLYRIKGVVERVRQYWVFGSFAQHAYQLKMADKKLVEAKVLFEYQQYSLAVRSLTVSDDHFQKAVSFLGRARGEGKDISPKTERLQAAAEKHREVLIKLREDLPSEFVWQPEKQTAEKLSLEQLFNEAIKVRIYE